MSKLVKSENRKIVCENHCYPEKLLESSFHHSINSFQVEEFDDDALGETEHEFQDVSHLKKSAIWQHFYRSSNKNKEILNSMQRRSMCKYCKKVFKSSVTNLWKHMRAYHAFKL